MYKVNTFVLFIIVYFTLCRPCPLAAQAKIRTNLSEYHLRGKVHLVIRKTFIIKQDSEGIKVKRQHLIPKTAVQIVFNKKERVINRRYYEGHHSVKTEKYTYLKNGALARRIVHSHKNKKQYWYIYNPAGNLIEVKVVIPGEWVTKDFRYLDDGITAIYNESRKLAKMVIILNLGRGYKVKKFMGLTGIYAQNIFIN